MHTPRRDPSGFAYSIRVLSPLRATVIGFIVVSLALEYEACYLGGVQEVIFYRLTE